MDTSYDSIANHYDFLSRLVFGQAQVKAQVDQLQFLRANCDILIVGGGTGWILSEMTKIYPSSLNITYVEASAEMLSLAKQCNYGSNNVQFIHLPIELFKTTQRFDFILTPFLFDNFNVSTAQTIFDVLDQLLLNGGEWFLVDFYLENNWSKLWKWLVLKSMYLFFNLINAVRTHQLVEVSSYFKAHNYTLLNSKFYYYHFIKASIYKKVEVLLRENNS